MSVIQTSTTSAKTAGPRCRARRGSRNNFDAIPSVAATYRTPSPIFCTHAASSSLLRGRKARRTCTAPADQAAARPRALVPRQKSGEVRKHLAIAPAHLNAPRLARPINKLRQNPRRRLYPFPTGPISSAPLFFCLERFAKSAARHGSSAEERLFTTATGDGRTGGLSADLGCFAAPGGHSSLD